MHDLPFRPGRWLHHERQQPRSSNGAEVKAGARFPDGSILALVSTVVTLPAGPSILTLVPQQPLPGGLPTVDLLVEAAILEPVLGVTLSRHSVLLHLLP